MNQSVLSNAPREVNITDLVNERASEMCNLLSVIQASTQLSASRDVYDKARTYIQRLPRHMRRRAMTHNLRRVPRRLRTLAIPTLQHSKHRKKPPSRKWRRRPCRLLNEYLRRSRKGPTWLATHIWHAKRFHMHELWGYKVPFTPTQRSFRPTYRDCVKHCVVSDISYYCTLQLIGPVELLLSKLKSVTSFDVGLTFASKMSLAGNSLCKLTLYKQNTYPLNAIGPVEFMWLLPPDSVEDGLRKRLVIFVHPAIFVSVLDLLKDVFELNPVCSEEPPNTLTDVNYAEIKFYPLKDRKPESYADTNHEVSLLVCKDRLARFCLLGPRSTDVLVKAFSMPSETELKAIKETLQCGTGSVSSVWWHLHLQNYLNKSLTRVTELLKNRVDGQFHNGFCLPVLARDPRSLLSHDKNALPAPVSGLWSTVGTSNLLNESYSATCCLFDLCMSQVLLPVLSTEKLNERSQALGAFIGRSGANHCGQFSGWNLILPAGWARPFWLSLQYNTARACGLSELRHISLEKQELMFPENWPDTAAGVAMERDEENALASKYAKQPANKRLNFRTLKIMYPMRFPWGQLVAEWKAHFSLHADPNGGKVYVLRNRRILNCLKSLSLKAAGTEASVFDPRTIAQYSSLSSNTSTDVSIVNALVPIRIQSFGKGVPKPRSILCIPTAEDIVHLKLPKIIRQVVGPRNATSLVHEPKETISSISENLLQDDVAVDCANIIVTSKGQQLVSGEAMKLSDFFVDLTVRKRSAKQRKRQKKQMKKLGLNERKEPEIVTDVPSSLVHSCSRTIIGSICSGGYSFSAAKGVGVGYVSFLGLQQLMPTLSSSASNCSNPYVLYRNVNSRYYRLATFSIIDNLM